MMQEILSEDESTSMRRGEERKKKKDISTMERVLEGVPNDDGQT